MKYLGVLLLFLLTDLTISIATSIFIGMYAYIWDSFGEMTTFVQFGGKIRFYCRCPNPAGTRVLGFSTPGPLVRTLNATNIGAGEFMSDDLIINHSLQLGDYTCLCENASAGIGENFIIRILYRTCNITETMKYRRNNCKPDEVRSAICVKTVENIGKAIEKCTYLTRKLCNGTHRLRKQSTEKLMCSDEMIFYSLCEAYAFYQDRSREHPNTYSIEYDPQNPNRTHQHCNNSKSNKRYEILAVDQNAITIDQQNLSCAQLANVPGALHILEYGSVWANLAGVLRFCLVCDLDNLEQVFNLTRKTRSRAHSPYSTKSLRCDPYGYASVSFNMSHIVTSGLITLRFTWDDLEVEKNFRFVSTELLVNLTPNDRCGRMKHLICQYDLDYDEFNFVSKISWKFNGVPLKKMGNIKVNKEDMSILAIHKPGNYTCAVETIFNMAETRRIIRDENYDSFFVKENCLSKSSRKKDSGILTHVFVASGILFAALIAVLVMNIMYRKNLIGPGQQFRRRFTTYSTSKTASISPTSVNVGRPKSSPLSTKSKSKTST